MSVECTRKIEFDAGHRVLWHAGKCRNLHGHRYVAEVTARVDSLNDLSMVIDFGILKSIVGGWIDSQWDHNMILHPKDPLLTMCKDYSDLIVDGDNVPSDDIRLEYSFEDVVGRRPYVMPHDLNPTAEAMALVLFEQCLVLLEDHPVTVTNIRLFETPNCWATCNEDQYAAYREANV